MQCIELTGDHSSQTFDCDCLQPIHAANALTKLLTQELVKISPPELMACSR